MKDNHLHYTGSLPREFIFDKLRERLPSFVIENGIISFSDFDNYLNNKFSDNYIKNRLAFDEIYELFQSVSKPQSDSYIQNSYADGCYEISKKTAANNLSEFTIIAGAYPDIQKTRDRYLGMIKGFEMAEAKGVHTHGKITITFIRGSDGKMKNFSNQLLDDIFGLIKQPIFNNRISGFDISGYEYPNKNIFNENIEILQKIIEKKKAHGLDMDIGLHAGEIITGTSDDLLYTDYFIKLSNLDIQRIAHGTYLWTNIDAEKTEILKRFVGKCVFDICPISNKLLTPLGDASVPVDVFNSIGLGFTLNRDDPSILGNWGNP